MWRSFLAGPTSYQPKFRQNNGPRLGFRRQFALPSPVSAATPDLEAPTRSDETRWVRRGIVGVPASARGSDRDMPRTSCPYMPGAAPIAGKTLGGATEHLVETHTKQRAPETPKNWELKGLGGTHTFRNTRPNGLGNGQKVAVLGVGGGGGGGEIPESFAQSAAEMDQN